MPDNDKSKAGSRCCENMENKLLSIRVGRLVWLKPGNLLQVQADCRWHQDGSAEEISAGTLIVAMPIRLRNSYFAQTAVGEMFVHIVLQNRSV